MAEKWVWFLYGVGVAWGFIGVLAGLVLLLVGRRESKEKTPGVALTFEERRRRWPREVR